MNRNGNGESGKWVRTLGGLGWPLLLGASLAAVFYGLILHGPLQSELTRRYFATHPVSYVATCMFFVGLAALVLKMADALRQLAICGRVEFPAETSREATHEDSWRLLQWLDELPLRWQNTYLIRRVRTALEYVDRRRSAHALDEELKYLSDMDAVRQQESFALVRIIIWATPMLGFLGTVIGITQALGDLDAEVLATDPKTAMQGLLAGLYIAFDTTALALSLSIVLMFLQFLADRIESHLLATVDHWVDDALLGYFSDEAAPRDPHLAAMERMSTGVLQTAEKLVREQTDHWKKTLAEANRQWCEMMRTSGGEIRQSLAEALDDSLSRFAAALSETEREADARLHARWEQWQTALSNNARLLHSQQVELSRQSEIMRKVLEATGDVMKLEEALNENLRALAGSQHFEETVMSLSAAIHLLNARMHERTTSRSVTLDSSGEQGRAA